jgi:hypothetical protein
VEQDDHFIDVFLELEAITEREGWRNLYMHAVDASLRREGRQDIPRRHAQSPTKSSDPFVSDRHNSQISGRAFRGNWSERRLHGNL